jgi:signal transduction histidine kinase
MLRLFRTTSFRFTLFYLLVFVLAVGLLSAVVYRVTFGAAVRETNLAIENDIAVLEELFAENGAGTLRRVIQQRVAFRDDSMYMLIAAPSGARLAGNLTALPREALEAEGDFFDFEFELPVLDAAGREIGIQFREARGKVSRFRPADDDEQSYLVFVARDVGAREFMLENLSRWFLRIASATLAFGVVVGLLFSRALLQRVDAVNKTARAIRDGDLSRRIPQSGVGDELDHLGANLNAMLDQIERLMTGMRDVSDNIAHDLRSPLTRIRNRLTDALKADAKTKDEALRVTLEEAERMIATFNALLSIARIQSGEGAGAMRPIDLVAIAQEMAELYEPAAQEAGFELTLEAEPTPLVKGSRELVSQAIANFLDNALKYAAGGSRIEFKVGPRRGGGAYVSVADDGVGVQDQDRQRIFERFVRLEGSRSTPGSGLGLSLVAAIARAHDARLRLEDGLARTTSKGATCGLRVVMDFPALGSQ